MQFKYELWFGFDNCNLALRIQFFDPNGFNRHRTIATSILHTFVPEALRKPVPKAVRSIPSGSSTVEVDCTLQNQAVAPVMLPTQVAKT